MKRIYVQWFLLVALFLVIVILGYFWRRPTPEVAVIPTECGLDSLINKNVYEVTPTNFFPPISNPGGLAYALPPGADWDLHAYTLDGKKHIGENYRTKRFEYQIPSSCFSNDAPSGPEWITVPSSVPIYTVIDMREVVEWAKQYGFTLEPFTLEWQLIHWDANGNRVPGGKYPISIDPRTTTKIEIHDDNGDGIPENVKAMK